MTAVMSPLTVAVAAGVVAFGRGVELSAGPEVLGVACPSSCEDLFGRLEEGVQEVELQLRGEPKSGTGTSGEWAWGGLAETCSYLQGLYGEQSCRVEYEKDEKHHAIVFEPQLGENAPCACDGVKRVEIGFSLNDKHKLPVGEECTFSHRNSLPEASDEICRRRGSLPVENGADLWQCVDEAECAFNDQHLQLAVMRDPRAVTVSSYFHRLREFPDSPFEFDDSVDTYFQEMLGLTCMWTSIRHLLFTKLLADQSELFMFEDLLLDPVDWYGRLFSLAGLHLPFEFIYGMAHTASGGGSNSAYGRIDEHPGGHASEGKNSTFRDELGPDSLAMMDDVVRLWLPPVLLQRFGIEP